MRALALQAAEVRGLAERHERGLMAGARRLLWLGERPEVVADALGCSVRTLYRRLNRAGVAPLGRRAA